IRDKGIYQYRDPGQPLELISATPRNGLSLQADEKRRLWIGTDDGLYAYDLAHHSISRAFKSNNRLVHLTLEHNNLWIASDGEGVLIKNIDSGGVRALF